MEYFRKIADNPYQDLYWNLPEVKQGRINVIGGNEQSFRAPVRLTEFLKTKYPLKEVGLVLPESLRKKLPEVPELEFLSATESGAFKDADEIMKVINEADFNILIGDFSRNTITIKAISDATSDSEKPLIATRDTVDLLAEKAGQSILMRENLILVASLAQLIKIFRAIYYPKMLLLSQSLTQVADALHKFTLSYPIKLLTLHDGQILIAENGEVVAVPLQESGFSPITIWGGELAGKIAVFNLFNPKNFIKASVAGIFEK